jgi:hypothetical protein
LTAYVPQMLGNANFYCGGNQRGVVMRITKAIANLRQQIHDDLRRQHPEWVLPNGECPMCDAYEARLMEELWDLSTQAWTNTGNLHDSRSGPSVTVLPNGQALVAGGGQTTKHTNGFVVLSSAELYTP